MNSTIANDTLVKEIVIRAPAERIFEALTNPDQRLRWWGAEGQYRGTHMESDLRPGGKWLTRGIGRGDKSFHVHGEYRVSSGHACWSSRGCRTGMRTRPNPWFASIWTKETVSPRCAWRIRVSFRRVRAPAIRAGRRCWAG
jgi:Activator of Hsp90 ATPase homolog 1-like protein